MKKSPISCSSFFFLLSHPPFCFGKRSSSTTSPFVAIVRFQSLLVTLCRCYGTICGLPMVPLCRGWSLAVQEAENSGNCRSTVPFVCNARPCVRVLWVLCPSMVIVLRSGWRTREKSGRRIFFPMKASCCKLRSRWLMRLFKLFGD